MLPATAANCPTNDHPTVAALHVLTERALELPTKLASAAERARWAALRAALPPVPMTVEPDGTVVVSPYETYADERTRHLSNVEVRVRVIGLARTLTLTLTLNLTPTLNPNPKPNPNPNPDPNPNPNPHPNPNPNQTPELYSTHPFRYFTLGRARLPGARRRDIAPSIHCLERSSRVTCRNADANTGWTQAHAQHARTHAQARARCRGCDGGAYHMQIYHAYACASLGLPWAQGLLNAALPGV